MNSNQKKTIRQFIHETWGMVVLSFAVVLFVEWLNHSTFAKLLVFLQEHPWMFLFNVQIVFNTFLFAEIWKRRTGARLVTLLLWIVLGIVNYMVTATRVLPFTTRDLLLIPDGIKMITVYFRWYEIVGVVAGIVAVVVAIALMLTKPKKRERFNRLASISVFLLSTVITMLLSGVPVQTGSIDWEKESLVKAYRDNGFAYCFTYTFADFGIAKPVDYSEELIEEIVSDIADSDVPLVVEPEATLPIEIKQEIITPNIIYVQLESFFDVNSILDAEYSENPIPVFTKLMKEWPSGQIKVPSVGGGTANTEFEVLTGMNLDYFAAGEFPYNTVLKDTTCETISFNLKPLGYTTTAVHNYTGTFYARNKVYSQLGFDYFVSQEYMHDLEYNDLGWAKDKALTGEILQAMEGTEGLDFVFTVTVQSHGKYSTTKVDGLSAIEVLKSGEPVNAMMLQNYVNELSEVDQFIDEFLTAIKKFDEPVVVLFYGDHLPALGIEDTQLASGDMYQTTYVLWNNFDMQLVAPDIQAYQISANVLKQLGIENGGLTRFHQHFGADCTDEPYLAFLRVLEYDMLYGELSIYEGVNPYQPTKLVMGSVPIRSTSAVYDRAIGTLSVYGENFTPYSDILINDVRQKAVFVDSTRLIARVGEVTQEDSICVGQFTRENEELSRTNVIKLEED